MLPHTAGDLYTPVKIDYNVCTPLTLQIFWVVNVTMLSNFHYHQHETNSSSFTVVWKQNGGNGKISLHF